MLIVFNL